MSVCACGCGTLLRERVWDGKKNPPRIKSVMFANGHNRRLSIAVYCRGRLVRAYVHDGEGWCSGCHSWIGVVT